VFVLFSFGLIAELLFSMASATSPLHCVPIPSLTYHPVLFSLALLQLPSSERFMARVDRKYIVVISKFKVKNIILTFLLAYPKFF